MYIQLSWSLPSVKCSYSGQKYNLSYLNSDFFEIRHIHYVISKNIFRRQLVTTTKQSLKWTLLTLNLLVYKTVIGSFQQIVHLHIFGSAILFVKRGLTCLDPRGTETASSNFLSKSKMSTFILRFLWEHLKEFLQNLPHTFWGLNIETYSDTYTKNMIILTYSYRI